MRQIEQPAQRSRGRSPEPVEIPAIFHKRRRQILTIFVLLTAAVVAGVMLMPRTYKSRMKFIVKNDRPDVVLSAETKSPYANPGDVTEARINTEIELLNNNDILRQVVAACGLDKNEMSKHSKAGSDPGLAVEKAVRRLQKDLAILPVRKSDVIEVDYSSRNPHQTVDVLRKLAAFYLEEHLRLHGSPGTYNFFLQQAAHYQTELRNDEAKLTEFRRKHNIVLLGPQKEEFQRRQLELDSNLLATEAAIRQNAQKLSNSQDELAAAQPRVVTQSRTMSNQYSVERLGTMLAELQNKRTQLLSKFRPDDRTVVEVSKEIEDTQAALEKTKSLTGSEQATDVNPVRQSIELNITNTQSDLAGLKARRDALAEQSTDYQKRLSTLDGSTASYDDLQRQEKEAEENYQLYSRKSEEARISELLDRQKIANVAVAENAVEPHLPSSPNVPLFLSVGTLLAAMTSIAVAFCAEYMTQRPAVAGWGVETLPQGPRHSQLNAITVEDAAELKALTGLPVLVSERRV